MCGAADEVRAALGEYELFFGKIDAEHLWYLHIWYSAGVSKIRAAGYA